MDFSWITRREAGVFLHISSLPSDYGIGNIGSAADAFLDFAQKAGFSYWQICPLGPTGYEDSPYQSFSAFAGNIYFIDFEALRDMSLLDDAQLAPLRGLPKDRCDYGAIYAVIPDLVRAAAANFFASKTDKSAYEKFCKDNAKWLDSYALFSALKRRFGSKCWLEWDDPKFRDFSYAKTHVPAECVDEIASVKFGQWVFFSQYEKFRAKAHKHGIEIFGDIPIFLSLDSADVWANPELFELDKKTLKPKNVAGVAPDYFSETGQLWGNPLYDWKNARRRLFAFWHRRIAAAAQMYDVIRFDHFRGFADYWSIPAKYSDARKGSLKKGPDREFFEFIKREFPRQKFVAEDLGLLSKAAFKLRDDINIPSMAVLQFAFGDTPKNPYLPHNVRRNCVYYTGTHDNNTSIGWYESATEAAKDEARRYFRASGDAVNWDMIHAVMLSVAAVAVFPMQDIIGLGAWARTNTPGKPDGNWQWRMTAQQLEKAVRDNAPYLHSLCELSDRLKNCVEK